MRIGEIEWEQTSGRADPALVTFLHSQIREDRHNGNGGFVTKGFGALRRSHLVSLFRRFEVPLEREDLPFDQLVMRANMAWSSGQFGDRQSWMNPGNKELSEAKARIERLESMLAKVLEGQIEEAPKVEEPRSIEKPAKRGPSTWNQLQKLAKSKGIDISGKNKEQLEAEIKALEDVP